MTECSACGFNKNKCFTFDLQTKWTDSMDHSAVHAETRTCAVVLTRTTGGKGEGGGGGGRGGGGRGRGGGG
eukprot:9490287-Pyramimonas_sp.AAC.1